jgi:ABC-type glycerol-3-phosphate transport system permease component
MARRVFRSRPASASPSLAWVVALVLFSPILWVVLTAFKTEAEAIASPPTFLPQTFTLENFSAVQDRSDYIKHAHQFDHRLGGLDPARARHRHPRRLVHGLRANQKAPRIS